MSYILHDTTWLPKPVWQQDWQQLNDSLQKVVMDKSFTTAGDNEIGRVVSQLDDISTYGFGFGDVLSLIAIPLIIALFAFAFPFLFSVITHIHNKYESERISQMLSGSKAYKWFLLTSGGCAVFLVMIGAVAIVIRALSWYSVAIKAIECLSIAVAAVYSYVIVWFVYTCIRYNQPETLIKLIDERYNSEKKKVDGYLKGLDKKEKRLGKMAESEQFVWMTGLHLGRSWSKEGIETLRSERLVALVSHALRTKNNHLFQQILNYVNTISQELKMEDAVGASVSINTFYLGCMDAYLHVPEDTKTEDLLLMYWFQSISRNRLPWERGIADMLSKIVHSSKIGRDGLMARYFQDASWRYGFLHNIPSVSFVKGDDVDIQQEMDIDERRTWNDLCKMHFFVAAYLFSEGYYKAVKFALPRRGGDRKLLPFYADEILRTYSKCKRGQGELREFHDWYVGIIAGKNVEPDIFERYTAFRLMTATDMRSPYHMMLGDDERKIIEENQKSLCDYALLLQQDIELTTLFPGLQKVKFERVLSDCVESLLNGDVMSDEKGNRSIVRRIIDGVEWFCCEKRKEVSKKRIFDAEIPQLTYENLEIHAGNMIFGNRGMLTNGIAGVAFEDKTDVMELGTYAHTTSKWAYFEAIPFHMHLIFGDFMEVFRARYYYLLLQAIAQMNIEEEHLTPDKFGVYLQKIVKDHGADYMLIDCNSAMTSFMKYDEHDDEENWYSRVTTYLGSNVQQLDIQTSDYLRDLKNISGFQGTLLIIKQRDIPYLDAVVAGERCKLTHEEHTDRRKGRTNMRMTVDSNYLIRYSKSAKVIKVYTEKMDIKG